MRLPDSGPEFLLVQVILVLARVWTPEVLVEIKGARTGAVHLTRGNHL